MNGLAKSDISKADIISKMEEPLDDENIEVVKEVRHLPIGLKGK